MGKGNRGDTNKAKKKKIKIKRKTKAVAVDMTRKLTVMLVL